MTAAGRPPSRRRHAQHAMTAALELEGTHDPAPALQTFLSKIPPAMSKHGYYSLKGPFLNAPAHKEKKLHHDVLQ